ncbi:MAG: hypothetical protein ABJN65_11345 [Parasphingorhabdus sp.]
MKIIRSLTIGTGLAGMSVSVSAQDYPYEKWANLWERTCGSIDSVYSVIENPDAQGWIKADASSDEPAARIIEAAKMNAQGSIDDATLTSLFVLRQSNATTNALAAFQEMRFVAESNSYLLACSLYDTGAPTMSTADLSRLSPERPFVDTSNNGLAVIEWPEGLEGSGRIKMTAGSIPEDHPGTKLLLGGLVLKTQYVFSEETE